MDAHVCTCVCTCVCAHMWVGVASVAMLIIILLYYVNVEILNYVLLIGYFIFCLGLGGEQEH